jgi:uncharacterized protein YceH (UPF0502 family)
VEPDAVEMRVLGCLLEKQRTTPDAYPLTLNSLRLACNQATNRDPVVDYDEREIRGALERLGRRRWTRLASWGNSRVKKYRHLLDETLELSDAELSLLAVLMLRGPQTVGELNQRSERLHRFEDGELEQTLTHLGERELVQALPRRPGERGQRYQQLLGDGDADGAEGSAALGASAPSADADVAGAGADRVGAAPDAESAPGAEHAPDAGEPVAATPPSRPAAAAATDASIEAAELVGRVEHLERELAAVRAELRELRAELGG